MTNRSLATGVFRAWGMMWLAYAFLGIPQLLTFLVSKPYSSADSAMHNYALWSYVSALLASLAVSAFLIVRAGWLADRVFTREESLHVGVDGAEFQAILFSVVGLYFALDGLRDLAGSAHILISRPSGDSRGSLEYLWAERWKTLITSAAEIIFGVGLFFGSRGLRNLWRRYRGVGSNAASSDPAEPGGLQDDDGGDS